MEHVKRQRRTPESLLDEIIEVYQENMERPSNEILTTLNAPHRIQRRGFVVDAGHLLGAIIDRWHIGPRTRFAAYDYDSAEMCSQSVFYNHEEAVADAEDSPNAIVVRFEV